MAQEAGLLLAEDSAIKELVSGLVVTDDRSAARTVPVFYRWPDSDVEKKYPFITIEMVGMQHATERERSAQTIYLQSPAPGPGDPMHYLDNPAALPYWPSEVSDVSELANWDSTHPVASTVELTPVNFIYRIATHTRNPRHDRQITAQLFARNRIPFRYGELFVDADNTVRRLFNIGWQAADYDDGEATNRKRIFRKIVLLTFNGEMGFNQLTPLGLVREVVVNIESF